MQLDLRFLQIDLARQKETVEYVKSYIDFAAQCGYNAVLFYLENAVRTESTPFFSPDETYSADEISEMVAYAQKLGLDAVPALENLGHMEKFFFYPEFGKLSEINDVRYEGRGFDNYPRGACACVSHPDLYEITDRYIREVCALFPSEYVHMGLDEPFDFAICSRCAERVAAGESKSDMYLKHVLHTYELAKSMGKTMMMWDDFFEYADIVRSLPRDIILCNWNYVFVGDEPQGHWTNRIKEDWFRLYDELGFRYMFCVYAHRASSLYNVDTFTAYAEKHSPIGAIMTAWRRSDSFYLGAYPQIAYAARLWNGAATRENAAEIFAEILGDKEIAELICSLNIVECGYRKSVTSVCENDYMLKLSYRAQLCYVLPRIATAAKKARGSAKDILTDIYDYIAEIYVNLLLQKLSVDVFDGYISSPKTNEYLKALDCAEKIFGEIESNARGLWKKYRGATVSYLNAFDNKFASYRRAFADVREKLCDMSERGVLTIELMMYDPYATVKCGVKALYVGETEYAEIYDGPLKPSAALFEWGGCYGFRFAAENREIEAVRFSVYGEGALYPLNFRYIVGGKKYAACSVEVSCGKVENAENVLFDDTRFCAMGTDDGKAHFENFELSRQKHEIAVRLKKVGSP